MNRYLLTRTAVDTNKCRCTVYGIRYGSLIIDDITFDKKALLREIKLFNRFKLEPSHIYDAVDNFLAEMTAKKVDNIRSQ
ncbi:MAG: hypothetical protein RR058_03175 [Oscillospiraceae bacterium]